MKRAVKNAVRRALGFVLALFLLSIAVFFLSRLSPGDPLRSYYGESAERLSESERADALDRLGLDRRSSCSMARGFKTRSRGDFGVSFQYKRDVMTVIGGVYGNTLLLGVTAYLLTFGLALLLGAFCALREDSPADRAVRRIGTVTGCIPSFWLALLLILLFSVELGLLPSSGAYDIGRPYDLLGRLRHLVLPLARAGARAPLVLRLPHPQPPARRGAAGLCPALPRGGAQPPQNPFHPVPAQRPALLFRVDGGVDPAYSGRHLHRGKGVFLSGAGHTLF